MQNRNERDGQGAPEERDRTKGGTELGVIPANVSDRVLATVTSGLAKLVEEVKK
jgi:hypothetical protein